MPPVEQKPAEQPEAPQQPQASAPQPQSQQPQKSSNTALIIVIVVVVLGAVVLGGGFFAMRAIKERVSQKVGQKIGESMVEKAIEQGTGQKADVNADEKSVSIKTDSGTFSASGEGTVKLPADFPTDVYVPSDAKISFATSTPANAASGTKAGFMIGFGTSQSVSDVVAKYKSEMAKNGWVMETESNYGGMIVNFTKGSRSTLITVATNEGQDTSLGATGVSVAVSEN